MNGRMRLARQVMLVADSQPIERTSMDRSSPAERGSPDATGCRGRRHSAPST
jgi:hypothetical protein